VNFGPESPWDAKKSEGCKKFFVTLLIHRLAERDEIWHIEGIGAWQVLKMICNDFCGC